MMKAFRTLAKMRKYRGTVLDVFGRTEERRMERALVVEYEKVVEEILARLTPQNHATAVDLASIPEHIRGYGHVKDAHLKTAKTREAALLAAFRTPSAAPRPAVVKVVV
jgi:indolepyruvate ferredoxin oxidoreductase